MTKQLFSNFIKDKILLIILYFVNSSVLTLFFYLSTNSSVELIYPLLISIFFFAVLLLIEWFKYKSFNESLAKRASNPYVTLKPFTKEQTAVCNTLDIIHKNYLNKMDTLNTDIQNKKRFLSQWIHSMKTPVSVIDLIIQKAVNDNEGTEALKNIEIENQKLYSGLEQALSFMRIDEFSKDYEPQTVNLAQSIKSIINNRKSQFIYNNVFPKLNLSDESIPVLTDFKWNEVMIDQIISNAVKYSFTENQPKNIYIGIQQEGPKTFLTIRDEGIGIPSYDLGRVFEPFFTGENGRKCRNSTGVGLYICSVIAQKLGHEIDIQSHEGCGTEVTISYLSKL